MLQPSEFKIYNASAGAGKTYTLVREYLSILLSSSNPYSFESILAITFTNKAANEMKERILQQLALFSKADFSKNRDLLALSDELNLEPEIIRSRSKNILVKILHNYSQFSVSTIDKFNLRLMKSFAQDLGLSANFNVEMDTEKLLEESVDLLFSKIGEDESLTTILIEIALDNLQENKAWDISKNLVEDAKALYSDIHQQNLEKLQNYKLDEFNDFRRIVNKKVSEKKQKLKNIAVQFFQLIDENSIQADDFSGGRNGVSGFFKKFINDKFDFPTNTHLKNIENTDPDKFSSGKASITASITLQNIFPNIQLLFYQANEMLLNLPVWEGVQKTITTLSIINEVEKSVETLKDENNLLMISEFNKIISKNLQDQPSGFIYERIGNRFHHYFIDEFQDTSKLQWENLQPLLENVRSTSDTAMLVGDPKQSIYRFRGGNPELMLNLVDSKNQLPITIENLPKNWRSYDEIIRFNNEFYSFLAETITDNQYQNLYKEGNQQKINDKKGGFVQLNFIEKTRENISDEADLGTTELNTYQLETVQQIVKTIHSLTQKGFDYDEITILHRTKKEGKIIADYLTSQQIQVLSTESLLVANSPEIQLLELFFNVISNERDFTSRARFLFKLNELSKIKPKDITVEIKPLMVNSLQPLKEYLRTQNIFIDFVFEPSVSLFDFVERSVETFQLGKNGSSYVLDFLDFTLNYSLENEYNITRFLEHWEEEKINLSIALPEGINAVRLMTIHKSKGLEFPVVLLPFADWGSTNSHPKFWIPVEDDDLPFNHFMVNSFQGGKLEQVSDEIKEKIQKENLDFEMDNLNLLYVATTRAVEQLYIITHTTKEDYKGKSIAKYFNQYAKKYSTSTDKMIQNGNSNRVSEKKVNQNIEIKLPFVIENWNNRIAISKESSKRWKKRKAIVYGDLIHELMDTIYSEKDIHSTLKKALNSGIIQEIEMEPIKNLITQIIQHPKLKKGFNENTTQISEREFIDKNGKLFRPDRVTLDDKNCTIIDYKTGNESPKHIQQINFYASSLEKMGYTIQNKFLVYISDKIDVKEVD
ncbi:MAG: UvrD-helicase domain-containing protein [Moheibacter sp.]